MRKRIVWLFILGLPLILILALAACRSDPEQVQAQLIPGMSAADEEGFERADGPRPILFPQDHGPHPEFQTEWWYYTGNLEGQDGRRFGYQLTFFRRALLPVDQTSQRPSEWAANQVYMAHFALTDVQGRRFQAHERLARGAAGLSGAKAAPFEVWLEDWSVSETGLGVYRLQAAQDGLALDLTLEDTKGPILQGDQGYSPKGPEPGQASYYYSFTRLASSGNVQVGGATYEVTGWSWMDHEFSTSALAQDQVGWDWFALQMDEGEDGQPVELVVFQIRKADGSIDPASSGALVSPDGSIRRLSQEDFEIQVLDTWSSPHSQATYPSRWRVRVPSEGIVIEIEPYLADQELNVSYSYWEGAVRIRGQRGGAVVSGSGYIELTGYSGSMGGEF